MRIRSLQIQNFRAVANLQLGDLPDVVVLAGPNGCGKSTVLDAIRLLKSVYGGYQPNEWQYWMSEFQISPNQRPEDFLSLFQNPAKPLQIETEFQLTDEERSWLRAHAERLTRSAVWKQVAPELASWQSLHALPLATHIRSHAPEVERRTTENLIPVLAELAQPSFLGKLTILPNGNMQTAQSRVLELAFSLYAPQHVGVIDYHSAQRNYGREQVGGINLSLESSEQQQSQHSLYNSQNKYANIKSELAAGYVRELLAREAGVVGNARATLTETLKELFTTFFSGKEFLGPHPTSDGRLLFNVQTASGTRHDINELSAGEKEVLYGYLRLRNTAPRNSVLMIDEPELHLNPRLIQGLPDFYHRHLGVALGNQLWLVTHSDTLLRHAVGRSNFRVYHMQPPHVIADGNQAHEVRVTEELERAVVDLVGDLAVYRPGGKVVVLEGGGDSDFDVRMVGTLFPAFALRVNLLSAGNKQRVRDLHGLLDEARSKGALSAEFYSIVDRDAGEASDTYPGRVMSWDRYHIENYLLEPRYVLHVLKELGLNKEVLSSESGVDGALRSAAEATLPTLVRHQLERRANALLVGAISTRIDPNSRSSARELRSAIERSVERVLVTAETDLRAADLAALQRECEARLAQDLGDGSWRKTFRGRDILRRFTRDSLAGAIKYTVLRDLIIARMHDDGFEPEGMRAVLQVVIDG